MPWFLSDSLPEYAATAGGLLSERPAEHTILLGVMETLRAAGVTRMSAGQVLLSTDLAGPTSNALYQRLGYQPVEDRAVWSFHRSPAGGTPG